MRGMEPPLLYLDVDGPLIPFGGPPGWHPEHLTERRIRDVLGTAAGHPLLARLDPRIGARLAVLPCRPVWATTWEHVLTLHLAPDLRKQAEVQRATTYSWPLPARAQGIAFRPGSRIGVQGCGFTGPTVGPPPTAGPGGRP